MGCEHLRAYAHASVPIFWPDQWIGGEQPPDELSQGFPPIVGVNVIYCGDDLPLFTVDVFAVSPCDVIVAAEVTRLQTEEIVTPLSVCTDDLPAYIVGLDAIHESESASVVTPLIEAAESWQSSGIEKVTVESVANTYEAIFGTGVEDL